jgi:hypothetical protein
MKRNTHTHTHTHTHWTHATRAGYIKHMLKDKTTRWPVSAHPSSRVRCSTCSVGGSQGLVNTSAHSRAGTSQRENGKGASGAGVTNTGVSSSSSDGAGVGGDGGGGGVGKGFDGARYRSNAEMFCKPLITDEPVFADNQADAISTKTLFTNICTGHIATFRTERRQHFEFIAKRVDQV